MGYNVFEGPADKQAYEALVRRGEHVPDERYPNLTQKQIDFGRAVAKGVVKKLAEQTDIAADLIAVLDFDGNKAMMKAATSARPFKADVAGDLDDYVEVGGRFYPKEHIPASLHPQGTRKE
jgi:hypothetical protein